MALIQRGCLDPEPDNAWCRRVGKQVSPGHRPLDLYADRVKKPVGIVIEEPTSILAHPAHLGAYRNPGDVVKVLRQFGLVTGSWQTAGWRNLRVTLDWRPDLRVSYITPELASCR